MSFRRYRFIGVLIATVMLRAIVASSQTAAAPAQSLGAITGQVTDEVDVAIPGATITLEQDGTAASRATVSQEDGRFSFVNVVPGPFRLTVSVRGFAPVAQSGVLAPGDTATLPPIRLTLAAGAIAVNVVPDRTEIAERQIKQQEQQRILVIIPNFNVSYDPHAAPLTPRQKFQLTWKTLTDPTQFVAVAISAGIQQARNDFTGFGDGPAGYGKRYAALYATEFTGTVFGHALFPALFKQDPRYFYKGTGSTRTRIGYAISRSVVRTGDNGRAQPDYSRILGHLAAGAISNFYYPPENRHGVGLTFSNAGLAVAGAAAGDLLQEFVWKHVTSHTPK
jgi:hypothetical protein